MFGTKEASVSTFSGMGCCSVCEPCCVLKRQVNHHCVLYLRGNCFTVLWYGMLFIMWTVFGTKEASGSMLQSAVGFVITQGI